MSAVGKMLYRVLREEVAQVNRARERAHDSALTLQGSNETTTTASSGARAPAPRQTIGGLEFFQRMSRATCRRHRWCSCSACGSRRLRRPSSCSPPSRARSSTTASGSSTAGGRRTLLDSALGCAINTCCPPGGVFTTLELRSTARGRCAAKSARCAAKRTSCTSDAYGTSRDASSTRQDYAPRDACLEQLPEQASYMVSTATRTKRGFRQ